MADQTALKRQLLFWKCWPPPPTKATYGNSAFFAFTLAAASSSTTAALGSMALAKLLLWPTVAAF